MEEVAFSAPKRGVTGTGLKIIAIVAMFIDHFAAILLEDYLSKVTPTDLSEEQLQAWFMTNQRVAMIEMVMLVMRMIGRFGFPLFAFLLVEGFQHTHSVKKYTLNLGAFALLSELPFNLGFSSKVVYPGYQNVFFTLLLGLLCMASISFWEEKWGARAKRPIFYLGAFLALPYVLYMFRTSWIYALIKAGIQGAVQSEVAVGLKASLVVYGILGLVSLCLFGLLSRKWEEARKNAFAIRVLSLCVFCFLGDLLCTDYGGGGVLTIAMMYFLRKSKKKAFSWGCFILTLMSPVEAFAYFMLIPVSKYNGERGRRLNKYFFYAFYPVHIALLYLITLLLGFTTFQLR